MSLRAIPAWLAGIIGLAACFSPIAPVGAPCASSGAQRCPAGQICVTRSGEEVCVVGGGGGDVDAGGGGGDRDGDGIADQRDNCPGEENEDQADEDGDGLGDVCDPCPPFDANGDGDGDGVGGSCDPNPAVPGDRITSFAGFDRSISGVAVSGPFTLGGTGFAIADAGPDESAVLTFAVPTTGRVEVRAAVTLFSLNVATDVLGSIGVVDQFASGDAGVVCQLSDLVDGTLPQLRVFDSAAATVLNSAPHAVELATLYELRLRRDGTTFTCRTTNPVLEIAGSSTLAPGSPRAGLRARGATARYDWVMVVTSP